MMAMRINVRKAQWHAAFFAQLGVADCPGSLDLTFQSAQKT